MARRPPASGACFAGAAESIALHGEKPHLGVIRAHECIGQQVTLAIAIDIPDGQARLVVHAHAIGEDELARPGVAKGAVITPEVHRQLAFLRKEH